VAQGTDERAAAEPVGNVVPLGYTVYLFQNVKHAQLLSAQQ
jgi:hypothetical protein